MKTLSKTLVLASLLAAGTPEQRINAADEAAVLAIGAGIALGSAVGACNMYEYITLLKMDYFLNAETMEPSLKKALLEVVYGLHEYEPAFRVADKIWPVGPSLKPNAQQEAQLIKTIKTWKKTDAYLKSPYTLLLFTDELIAELNALKTYKGHLTAKGLVAKTFNSLWQYITFLHNDKQEVMLSNINGYIERIEYLIEIIKNLPEYERQATLHAHGGAALVNV
jgi:hypothetical protein